MSVILTFAVPGPTYRLLTYCFNSFIKYGLKIAVS